MFLTALNVAGVSALIGVSVAGGPAAWLVGLGLAVSGINTALGLGSLWSADVSQFPTPDEVVRFARERGSDSEALAWRHFAALQHAVQSVDRALKRRIRLMRFLVIATPSALAVTVTAAVSALS